MSPHVEDPVFMALFNLPLLRSGRLAGGTDKFAAASAKYCTTLSAALWAKSSASTSIVFGPSGPGIVEVHDDKNISTERLVSGRVDLEDVSESLPINSEHESGIKVRPRSDAGRNLI